MRLLVVEDDRKTASVLREGLRKEGFSVDVCHDGVSGLEQALSGDYALMILDVVLPGLDGWGVLNQVRSGGSAMPILMLTARDALAHRVRGLSEGADDYLVKPFAFTELHARINAVLRRQMQRPVLPLVFEDIRLDASAGVAERAGRSLDLTVKEMQVLELLMLRRGEVLSRTTIAETVWDMAFESDSNIVDVNIRRLRAKIDDPFERKVVHTVRGRGYVFR